MARRAAKMADEPSPNEEERQGPEKPSLKFNLERPPLHGEGEKSDDLRTEAATTPSPQIARRQAAGWLWLFLVVLLLTCGAVALYVAFQFFSQAAEQRENKEAARKLAVLRRHEVACGCSPGVGDASIAAADSSVGNRLPRNQRSHRLARRKFGSAGLSVCVFPRRVTTKSFFSSVSPVTSQYLSTQYA